MAEIHKLMQYVDPEFCSYLGKFITDCNWNLPILKNKKKNKWLSAEWGTFFN